MKRYVFFGLALLLVMAVVAFLPTDPGAGPPGDFVSKTYGGIFNRPVGIDGSTDAVQFSVQANPTQTANLQVWENSSATPVASISSSGSMRTAKFLGVTPGSLTLTGTAPITPSASVMFLSNTGTVTPSNIITTSMSAGDFLFVVNVGSGNIDFTDAAPFYLGTVVRLGAGDGKVFVLGDSGAAWYQVGLSDN